MAAVDGYMGCEQHSGSSEVLFQANVGIFVSFKVKG